jgi:hypothetical protein
MYSRTCKLHEYELVFTGQQNVGRNSLTNETYLPDNKMLDGGAFDERFGCNFAVSIISSMSSRQF